MIKYLNIRVIFNNSERKILQGDYTASYFLRFYFKFKIKISVYLKPQLYFISDPALDPELSAVLVLYRLHMVSYECIYFCASAYVFACVSLRIYSTYKTYFCHTSALPWTVQMCDLHTTCSSNVILAASRRRAA